MAPSRKSSVTMMSGRGKGGGGAHPTSSNSFSVLSLFPDGRGGGAVFREASPNKICSLSVTEAGRDGNEGEEGENTHLKTNAEKLRRKGLVNRQEEHRVGSAVEGGGQGGKGSRLPSSMCPSFFSSSPFSSPSSKKSAKKKDDKGEKETEHADDEMKNNRTWLTSKPYGPLVATTRASEHYRSFQFMEMCVPRRLSVSAVHSLKNEEFGAEVNNNNSHATAADDDGESKSENRGRKSPFHHYYLHHHSPLPHEPNHLIVAGRGSQADTRQERDAGIQDYTKRQQQGEGGSSRRTTSGKANPLLQISSRSPRRTDSPLEGGKVMTRSTSRSGIMQKEGEEEEKREEPSPSRPQQEKEKKNISAGEQTLSSRNGQRPWPGMPEYFLLPKAPLPVPPLSPRLSPSPSSFCSSTSSTRHSIAAPLTGGAIPTDEFDEPEGKVQEGKEGKFLEESEEERRRSEGKKESMLYPLYPQPTPPTSSSLANSKLIPHTFRLVERGSTESGVTTTLLPYSTTTRGDGATEGDDDEKGKEEAEDLHNNNNNNSSTKEPHRSRRIGSTFEGESSKTLQSASLNALQRNENLKNRLPPPPPPPLHFPRHPRSFVGPKGGKARKRLPSTTTTSSSSSNSSSRSTITLHSRRKAHYYSAQTERQRQEEVLQYYQNRRTLSKIEQSDAELDSELRRSILLKPRNNNYNTAVLAAGASFSLTRRKNPSTEGSECTQIGGGRGERIGRNSFFTATPPSRPSSSSSMGKRGGGGGGAPPPPLSFSSTSTSSSVYSQRFPPTPSLPVGYPSSFQPEDVVSRPPSSLLFLSNYRFAQSPLKNKNQSDDEGVAARAVSSFSLSSPLTNQTKKEEEEEEKEEMSKVAAIEGGEDAAPVIISGNMAMTTTTARGEKIEGQKHDDDDDGRRNLYPPPSPTTAAGVVEEEGAAVRAVEGKNILRLFSIDSLQSISLEKRKEGEEGGGEGVEEVKIAKLEVEMKEEREEGGQRDPRKKDVLIFSTPTTISSFSSGSDNTISTREVNGSRASSSHHHHHPPPLPPPPPSLPTPHKNNHHPTGSSSDKNHSCSQSSSGSSSSSFLLHASQTKRGYTVGEMKVGEADAEVEEKKSKKGKQKKRRGGGGGGAVPHDNSSALFFPEGSSHTPHHLPKGEFYALRPMMAQGREGSTTSTITPPPSTASFSRSELGGGGSDTSHFFQHLRKPGRKRSFTEEGKEEMNDDGGDDEQGEVEEEGKGIRRRREKSGGEGGLQSPMRRSIPTTTITTPMTPGGGRRRRSQASPSPSVFLLPSPQGVRPATASLSFLPRSSSFRLSFVGVASDGGGGGRGIGEERGALGGEEDDPYSSLTSLSPPQPTTAIFNAALPLSLSTAASLNSQPHQGTREASKSRSHSTTLPTRPSTSSTLVDAWRARRAERPARSIRVKRMMSSPTSTLPGSSIGAGPAPPPPPPSSSGSVGRPLGSQRGGRHSVSIRNNRSSSSANENRNSGSGREGWRGNTFGHAGGSAGKEAEEEAELQMPFGKGEASSPCSMMMRPSGSGEGRNPGMYLPLSLPGGPPPPSSAPASPFPSFPLSGSSSSSPGTTIGGAPSSSRGLFRSLAEGNLPASSGKRQEERGERRTGQIKEGGEWGGGAFTAGGGGGGGWQQEEEVGLGSTSFASLAKSRAEMVSPPLDAAAGAAPLPSSSSLPLQEQLQPLQLILPAPPGGGGSGAGAGGHSPATLPLSIITQPFPCQQLRHGSPSSAPHSLLSAGEAPPSPTLLPPPPISITTTSSFLSTTSGSPFPPGKTDPVRSSTTSGTRLTATTTNTNDNTITTVAAGDSGCGSRSGILRKEEDVNNNNNNSDGTGGGRRSGEGSGRWTDSSKTPHTRVGVDSPMRAPGRKANFFTSNNSFSDGGEGAPRENLMQQQRRMVEEKLMKKSMNEHRAYQLRAAIRQFEKRYRRRRGLRSRASVDDGRGGSPHPRRGTMESSSRSMSSRSTSRAGSGQGQEGGGRRSFLPFPDTPHASLDLLEDGEECRPWKAGRTATATLENERGDMERTNNNHHRKQKKRRRMKRGKEDKYSRLISSVLETNDLNDSPGAASFSTSERLEGEEEVMVEDEGGGEHDQLVVKGGEGKQRKSHQEAPKVHGLLRAIAKGYFQQRERAYLLHVGDPLLEMYDEELVDFSLKGGRKLLNGALTVQQRAEIKKRGHAILDRHRRQPPPAPQQQQQRGGGGDRGKEIKSTLRGGEGKRQRNQRKKDNDEKDDDEDENKEKYEGDEEEEWELTEEEHLLLLALRELEEKEEREKEEEWCRKRQNQQNAKKSEVEEEEKRFRIMEKKEREGVVVVRGGAPRRPRPRTRKRREDKDGKDSSCNSDDDDDELLQPFTVAAQRRREKRVYAAAMEVEERRRALPLQEAKKEEEKKKKNQQGEQERRKKTTKKSTVTSVTGGTTTTTRGKGEDKEEKKKLEEEEEERKKEKMEMTEQDGEVKGVRILVEEEALEHRERDDEERPADTPNRRPTRLCRRLQRRSSHSDTREEKREKEEGEEEVSTVEVVGGGDEEEDEESEESEERQQDEERKKKAKEKRRALQGEEGLEKDWWGIIPSDPLYLRGQSTRVGNWSTHLLLPSPPPQRLVSSSSSFSTTISTTTTLNTSSACRKRARKSTRLRRTRKTPRGGGGGGALLRDGDSSGSSGSSSFPLVEVCLQKAVRKVQLAHFTMGKEKSAIHDPRGAHHPHHHSSSSSSSRSSSTSTSSTSFSSSSSSKSSYLLPSSSAFGKNKGNDTRSPSPTSLRNKEGIFPSSSGRVPPPAFSILPPSPATTTTAPGLQGKGEGEAVGDSGQRHPPPQQEPPQPYPHPQRTFSPAPSPTHVPPTSRAGEGKGRSRLGGKCGGGDLSPVESPPPPHFHRRRRPSRGGTISPSGSTSILSSFNVPLTKRLGECLVHHPPLHRCVTAAARLACFVLMRSLPKELYKGDEKDFRLLLAEEEDLLEDTLREEMCRSVWWEREKRMLSLMTAAALGSHSHGNGGGVLGTSSTSSFFNHNPTTTTTATLFPSAIIASDSPVSHLVFGVEQDLKEKKRRGSAQEKEEETKEEEILSFHSCDHEGIRRGTLAKVREVEINETSPSFTGLLSPNQSGGGGNPHEGEGGNVNAKSRSHHNAAGTGPFRPHSSSPPRFPPPLSSLSLMCSAAGDNSNNNNNNNGKDDEKKEERGPSIPEGFSRFKQLVQKMINKGGSNVMEDDDDEEEEEEQEEGQRGGGTGGGQDKRREKARGRTTMQKQSRGDEVKEMEKKLGTGDDDDALRNICNEEEKEEDEILKAARLGDRAFGMMRVRGRSRREVDDPQGLKFSMSFASDESNEYTLRAAAEAIADAPIQELNRTIIPSSLARRHKGGGGGSAQRKSEEEGKGGGGLAVVGRHGGSGDVEGEGEEEDDEREPTKRTEREERNRGGGPSAAAMVIARAFSHPVPRAVPPTPTKLQRALRLHCSSGRRRVQQQGGGGGETGRGKNILVQKPPLLPPPQQQPQKTKEGTRGGRGGAVGEMGGGTDGNGPLGEYISFSSFPSSPSPFLGGRREVAAINHTNTLLFPPPLPTTTAMAMFSSSSLSKHDYFPSSPGIPPTSASVCSSSYPPPPPPPLLLSFAACPSCLMPPLPPPATPPPPIHFAFLPYTSFMPASPRMGPFGSALGGVAMTLLSRSTATLCKVILHLYEALKQEEEEVMRVIDVREKERVRQQQGEEGYRLLLPPPSGLLGDMIQHIREHLQREGFGEGGGGGGGGTPGVIGGMTAPGRGPAFSLVGSSGRERPTMISTSTFAGGNGEGGIAEFPLPFPLTGGGGEDGGEGSPGRHAVSVSRRSPHSPMGAWGDTTLPPPLHSSLSFSHHHTAAATRGGGGSPGGEEYANYSRPIGGCGSGGPFPALPKPPVLPFPVMPPALVALLRQHAYPPSPSQEKGGGGAGSKVGVKEEEERETTTTTSFFSPFSSCGAGAKGRSGGDRNSCSAVSPTPPFDKGGAALPGEMEKGKGKDGGGGARNNEGGVSIVPILPPKDLRNRTATQTSPTIPIPLTIEGGEGGRGEDEEERRRKSTPEEGETTGNAGGRGLPFLRICTSSFSSSSEVEKTHRMADTHSVKNCTGTNTGEEGSSNHNNNSNNNHSSHDASPGTSEMNPSDMCASTTTTTECGGGSGKNKMEEDKGGREGDSRTRRPTLSPTSSEATKGRHKTPQRKKERCDDSGVENKTEEGEHAKITATIKKTNDDNERNEEEEETRRKKKEEVEREEIAAEILSKEERYIIQSFLAACQFKHISLDAHCGIGGGDGGGSGCRRSSLLMEEEKEAPLPPILEGLLTMLLHKDVPLVEPSSDRPLSVVPVLVLSHGGYGLAPFSGGLCEFLFRHRDVVDKVVRRLENERTTILTMNGRTTTTSLSSKKTKNSNRPTPSSPPSTRISGADGGSGHGGHHRHSIHNDGGGEDSSSSSPLSPTVFSSSSFSSAYSTARGRGGRPLSPSFPYQHRRDSLLPRSRHEDSSTRIFNVRRKKIEQGTKGVPKIVLGESTTSSSAPLPSLFSPQRSSPRIIEEGEGRRTFFDEEQEGGGGGGVRKITVPGNEIEMIGPGAPRARPFSFRPLLIEKLLQPGESLLPLSSLLEALRLCRNRNESLRFEEAKCFVPSIELRLLLDLVDSFAALSDSFSHHRASVKEEEELQRQKKEMTAAVSIAGKRFKKWMRNSSFSSSSSLEDNEDESTRKKTGQEGRGSGRHHPAGKLRQKEKNENLRQGKDGCDGVLPPSPVFSMLQSIMEEGKKKKKKNGAQRGRGGGKGWCWAGGRGGRPGREEDANRGGNRGIGKNTLTSLPGEKNTNKKKNGGDTGLQGKAERKLEEAEEEEEWEEDDFEEDLHHMDSNAEGKGRQQTALFFEIYQQTLREWSCVLICEAVMSYAVELCGPGLAGFRLASYEGTALLSESQQDDILRCPDIITKTIPNVPFHCHNPRVAYSVVEKNRSVVLEALVRLKGELYFLLTGLDYRDTLLSIHRRLLQIVKDGSLQQKRNRTVQRRVLPLKTPATAGVAAVLRRRRWQQRFPPPPHLRRPPTPQGGGSSSNGGLPSPGNRRMVMRTPAPPSLFLLPGQRSTLPMRSTESENSSGRGDGGMKRRGMSEEEKSSGRERRAVGRVDGISQSGEGRGGTPLNIRIAPTITLGTPITTKASPSAGSPCSTFPSPTSSAHGGGGGAGRKFFGKTASPVEDPRHPSSPFPTLTTSSSTPAGYPADESATGMQKTKKRKRTEKKTKNEEENEESGGRGERQHPVEEKDGHAHSHHPSPPPLPRACSPGMVVVEGATSPSSAARVGAEALSCGPAGASTDSPWNNKGIAPTTTTTTPIPPAATPSRTLASRRNPPAPSPPPPHNPSGSDGIQMLNQRSGVGPGVVRYSPSSSPPPAPFSPAPLSSPTPSPPSTSPSSSCTSLSSSSSLLMKEISETGTAAGTGREKGGAAAEPASSSTMRGKDGTGEWRAGDAVHREDRQRTDKKTCKGRHGSRTEVAVGEERPAGSFPEHDHHRHHHGSRIRTRRRRRKEGGRKEKETEEDGGRSLVVPHGSVYPHSTPRTNAEQHRTGIHSSTLEAMEMAMKEVTETGGVQCSPLQFVLFSLPMQGNPPGERLRSSSSSFSTLSSFAASSRPDGKKKGRRGEKRVEKRITLRGVAHRHPHRTGRSSRRRSSSSTSSRGRSGSSCSFTSSESSFSSCFPCLCSCSSTSHQSEESRNHPSARSWGDGGGVDRTEKKAEEVGDKHKKKKERGDQDGGVEHVCRRGGNSALFPPFPSSRGIPPTTTLNVMSADLSHPHSHHCRSGGSPSGGGRGLYQPKGKYSSPTAAAGSTTTSFMGSCTGKDYLRRVVDGSVGGNAEDDGNSDFVHATAGDDNHDDYFSEMPGEAAEFFVGTAGAEDIVFTSMVHQLQRMEDNRAEKNKTNILMTGEFFEEGCPWSENNGKEKKRVEMEDEETMTTAVWRGGGGRIAGAGGREEGMVKKKGRRPPPAPPSYRPATTTAMDSRNNNNNHHHPPPPIGGGYDSRGGTRQVSTSPMTANGRGRVRVHTRSGKEVSSKEILEGEKVEHVDAKRSGSGSQTNLTARLSSSGRMTRTNAATAAPSSNSPPMAWKRDGKENGSPVDYYSSSFSSFSSAGGAGGRSEHPGEVLDFPVVFPALPTGFPTAVGSPTCLSVTPEGSGGAGGGRGAGRINSSTTTTRGGGPTPPIASVCLTTPKWWCYRTMHHAHPGTDSRHTSGGGGGDGDGDVWDFSRFSDLEDGGMKRATIATKTTRTNHKNNKRKKGMKEEEEEEEEERRKRSSGKERAEEKSRSRGKGGAASAGRHTTSSPSLNPASRCRLAQRSDPSELVPPELMELFRVTGSEELKAKNTLFCPSDGGSSRSGSSTHRSSGGGGGGGGGEKPMRRGGRKQQQQQEGKRKKALMMKAGSPACQRNTAGAGERSPAPAAPSLTTCSPLVAGGRGGKRHRTGIHRGHVLPFSLSPTPALPSPSSVPTTPVAASSSASSAFVFSPPPGSPPVGSALSSPFSPTTSTSHATTLAQRRQYLRRLSGDGGETDNNTSTMGSRSSSSGSSSSAASIRSNNCNNACLWNQGNDVEMRIPGGSGAGGGAPFSKGVKGLFEVFIPGDEDYNREEAGGAALSPPWTCHGNRTSEYKGNRMPQLLLPLSSSPFSSHGNRHGGEEGCEREREENTNKEKKDRKEMEEKGVRSSSAHDAPGNAQDTSPQPWFTHGNPVYGHHRLLSKFKRFQPQGRFDVHTVSPLIALQCCLDTSHIPPLPHESRPGAGGRGGMLGHGGEEEKEKDEHQKNRPAPIRRREGTKIIHTVCAGVPPPTSTSLRSVGGGGGTPMRFHHQVRPPFASSSSSSSASTPVSASSSSLLSSSGSSFGSSPSTLRPFDPSLLKYSNPFVATSSIFQNEMERFTENLLQQQEERLQREMLTSTSTTTTTKGGEGGGVPGSARVPPSSSFASPRTGSRGEMMTIAADGAGGGRPRRKHQKETATRRGSPNTIPPLTCASTFSPLADCPPSVLVRQGFTQVSSLLLPPTTRNILTSTNTKRSLRQRGVKLKKVMLPWSKTSTPQPLPADLYKTV